MAAEETIQKMQSRKEFLEDEVGIKPEPILPFAKTLSAFAFMGFAFHRTSCWVNKIPLLNRLWKLRQPLTALMAEFGYCYVLVYSCGKLRIRKGRQHQNLMDM